MATKTRIDPIEFATYWQQAENVTDVAEHFNISNSAASVKASNLRARLVDEGFEPLKEFPKGGGANSLDIASLAGIVGLIRA